MGVNCSKNNQVASPEPSSPSSTVLRIQHAVPSPLPAMDPSELGGHCMDASLPTPVVVAASATTLSASPLHSGVTLATRRLRVPAVSVVPPRGEEDARERELDDAPSGEQQQSPWSCASKSRTTECSGAPLPGGGGLALFDADSSSNGSPRSYSTPPTEHDATLTLKSGPLPAPADNFPSGGVTAEEPKAVVANSAAVSDEPPSSSKEVVVFAMHTKRTSTSLQSNNDGNSTSGYSGAWAEDCEEAQQKTKSPSGDTDAAEDNDMMDDERCGKRRRLITANSTNCSRNSCPYSKNPDQSLLRLPSFGDVR